MNMTVEHIMHRAEVYADRSHRYTLHPDGQTLHDNIEARAALLAAVEEMAKDAERYRWLRSLEHCNEAWCFIGEGNANSNLDKAIDAAMKGQS